VTGHPHDQVLVVYATPLRDTDGTPRGAMVVLHDLTEMRRLEEVRQKFSANVSHELKTPLAAIGSLVDALIDDLEMPRAGQERFLQRIRDQNERLRKLVQDLLAIARLESANDVLECELLHAGALVSPCLRTFGPVAQQKGVSLELHTSNAPLWISVNAEAGRLIVNNLLDNAINYTPTGGQVTLSLVPHDSVVSIEVCDTGIGIAPEHLDRIFERFYRVDPSRSRRGGGVGLGLAIVKHLTGAMGGRVFVESTPGKGSVFTVQFPAARM
jgi:two-component system phosphate regulon sensor histidine kinase PhoR